VDWRSNPQFVRLAGIGVFIGWIYPIKPSRASKQLIWARVGVKDSSYGLDASRVTDMESSPNSSPPRKEDKDVN